MDIFSHLHLWISMRAQFSLLWVPKIALQSMLWKIWYLLISHSPIRMQLTEWKSLFFRALRGEGAHPPPRPSPSLWPCDHAIHITPNRLLLNTGLAYIHRLAHTPALQTISKLSGLYPFKESVIVPNPWGCMYTWSYIAAWAVVMQHIWGLGAGLGHCKYSIPMQSSRESNRLSSGSLKLVLYREVFFLRIVRVLTRESTH